MNRNLKSPAIHHGWNSDFESVVKGIGEESAAYAWMNRLSGSRRKWLDDIHDIAAMTLSAIAVLIQAVAGFATNPTLLIILSIAGPVISGAVSVILGVRKHFSWNTLYPLNELMYRRFTALTNECSMMLKLHRNHRTEPGPVFTEKVNKKYTKLMQSEENNILDKYRNKFMKVYANAGVQIPGRIEEIVVSKGSPGSDTKTPEEETPDKSSKRRGFPQIVREMLDSKKTTSTADTTQGINSLFRPISPRDRTRLGSPSSPDPKEMFIPGMMTTNANNQADKLMRKFCKSELLNNDESDYDMTNESLMDEMCSELRDNTCDNILEPPKKDKSGSRIKIDNISDTVIDIRDNENKEPLQIPKFKSKKNKRPSSTNTDQKDETTKSLSINIKKIFEQKDTDKRLSLQY
jgi:hypothetical protein